MPASGDPRNAFRDIGHKHQPKTCRAERCEQEKADRTARLDLGVRQAARDHDAEQHVERLQTQVVKENFIGRDSSKRPAPKVRRG